MTISELLDQVVFDAGDEDTAYRIAARRWLNLTRSDLANRVLWKWAARSAATLTTSAATTSGIYSLVDAATSSTGFEFIMGDRFYDETNSNVVSHDSMMTLDGADPDKSTTGQPTVWSDAGTTSAGVRQIYLWPIPDGTYTLRFNGYVLLTDVTDANDPDSADPFFGPISPWASTFTAGLRFYHDMNNNEDTNQVLLAKRLFDDQVTQRIKNNRLSLAEPLRMKVIKTQEIETMGRFDPGHYSNR
jgi:hypothetical protein